MADVSSGLVVGGEAPADPFEAALEAKGVTGGGSSATSSVADGLTFGPQTPEPVVETDTSGDVTTDDPEGEDAPLHDDPEVAAYLEKFGGDADKALRAAIEASKTIGRQGSELGELRQTVAKLEGVVETIQARPEPAAPAATLTREQIDQSIEEYGGLQLATWAANNAPHLVDSVLEAWGQDEAFAAMKFDREYQTWKATAEAAKATPSDPSKTEAYVAQEIEAKAMVKAMETVAKDFPEFDNFAEFLTPALEASPKIIQAGVLSEDEQTKHDSLKIVFERAEKLHQASLTQDAKAAQDAKRTAGKEAARVIKGQAGVPAPKSPAKGEPGSDEEGIAAFKRSILAAETTSVADGLTYGK